MALTARVIIVINYLSTCSSSDIGSNDSGRKGLGNMSDVSLRSGTMLETGVYKASISSRPYLCSASLYWGGPYELDAEDICSTPDDDVEAPLSDNVLSLQ